MATRFKPLKLDNPDYFGIGLAGSVGRGDKSHLLELAEKCLANDKVKLVMDLSELSALGGGGAVILADFQKRLVKVGGEILFVGAGEVVRHFLEQKFDDLPLNFFATATEAMGRPAARVVPDPGADEALEEVDQIMEAVPEVASPVVREDEPAVEPEDLLDPPDLAAASMLTEADEADPDSGLDDLLDEIKGPELRKGRRKDHRYASLNDAVQAMGEWVEAGDRRGFQKALGNLLFSNGLAEDMALFVVVKDRLKQADGTNWVPLDGALVTQVKEAARPLVMEDIRDEDLVEEELSLLETMQPDVLLPIMRQDCFWGLAMLNRGSLESEFSLAENFALELLMQVLAPAPAKQTIPIEPETDLKLPKAKFKSKPKPLRVGNGEDSQFQEVLLKLAMELPEAEDRSQFWRIFSRVVWPVLSIRTLAFLPVDRNFAHQLLGPENNLAAVDLSQEKLKSFFRTMQRPVQVGNLPDFFRETRKTLDKCGLEWLVALRDEHDYLGLILLGAEEFDLDTEDSVPDQMLTLFETAAQLLARFETQNETADMSLDLVRLLVAQRERRCFGSDSMTRSIVDHVNLLARELGFPPDQRRDLVCGSLLRDAGLVGQPDGWSRDPSVLSPRELSEYRDHPRQGAQLLKKLNLPKVIVEVVQYHHERFEGGGFPYQKTGRDIPLAARVVNIVENYVGMITGVGGQAPLTPAEASQALREDKDKRFDPDIVQVFLSVVSQEVPVAP